jgi:orotidine-5'-phosphate decarboxylase
VSSSQNFADRLAVAVASKRNPVCVGIDPDVVRLPEKFRPASSAPREIADRFLAFSQAIIDIVHPLVPVIKPQAAFFEVLGAPGWDALQKIVAYARQKNLLVVMDAKRGDIGNTAKAYATCFLDPDSPSELCSDALTINPYMGDDAMQPFLDCAHQHGNGLFVLVKTSNPGSKLFQDLTVGSDTVYERVADFVQQQSLLSLGESNYGNIGAVVGATHPEELASLRDRMPNCWLLIPGYGAQGGAAEDLRAAFDSNRLGAIINSSRNIIYAHQRPEYKDCSSWEQALERAVTEMIGEIQSI